MKARRGLKTRRSREDGAVAVVIGMASVLMFGLAAIGVDLGNAYSRDRESQTQADLMALAAAHLLPRSQTPDADRALVLEDYAEMNPVYGQGTPNFIDADLDNGWVEYDGDYRMRVFTPAARVEFGLAGAIGFSGVDVAARAAVEIRSPGRGPMPFFAVDGCDYGLQSLSDPQPNSTPPMVLPALQHSGNPSNATVSSISPTTATQYSSISSVAITGTNFTGNGSGPVADDPLVKQVGFFRAVGSTPTDLEVVPASGFTVNSQTSITVTSVPAAVLVAADTWYVRLLVDEKVGSAREERWTSANLAAALTVSPATAPTAGWTECPVDPNQGNFGAIELPRASSTEAGKWIEFNMLKGLDPDLTLDPYPGANPSDPTWDAACGPTDGSLTTITSTNSNDINSDTNCINTDAGFPSSPATTGLIEGIDSYDGLLDKATSPDPFSTTPGDGCAPDGTTNPATTAVRWRGNGSDVSVNNDVLTCFLTNDSVSLGQIAQRDATFPASAKHVISDKIFASPRFMWVPVFAEQPTNGLGYYKLVGFRAGFITDQPASATRATPTVGTGSHNGLIYTSNGQALKGIRVLYFNSQALPAVMAAIGPTFGYIGSGTKVPTLVE